MGARILLAGAFSATIGALAGLVLSELNVPVLYADPGWCCRRSRPFVLPAVWQGQDIEARVGRTGCHAVTPSRNRIFEP